MDADNRARFRALQRAGEGKIRLAKGRLAVSVENWSQRPLWLPHIPGFQSDRVARTGRGRGRPVQHVSRPDEYADHGLHGVAVEPGSALWEVDKQRRLRRAASRILEDVYRFD